MQRIINTYAQNEIPNVIDAMGISFKSDTKTPNKNTSDMFQVLTP